MAELMIRKIGGGIDFDDLTAQPSDVEKGKTFYGAGTEGIQVGIVENHGAKVQRIGINESYTFPAGIYESGSAVYQEVETQAGFSMTPVVNGSLAGIQGKYMTGDITVRGVENLVPENIKKGAFIGSVAGNWQGFVNTDIYTPYWYGVFAPGQTGTLKKNYELSYENYDVDWHYYNDAEDDGTKGDWIRFRSIYNSSTQYYRAWPAITFDTPIDMVNVKSVTIEYRLRPQFASDHTWLIVSARNADPIADYYWNFNGIGSHESFVLPATSNNGADFNTRTFTLSGGAYYYINVGLGVYQDASYGDAYMDIRYIRLNQ